ncbi:MAG: amidohydrolase [Sutterellaceae bacterium]|nr:amidohydrolase [Sutterellaceae bacterium]
MQFVHADKVYPEVLQWAEELVRFRRNVHETPELGFDTPKTVQRICDTLTAWGITTFDTEMVKGGVVVVIEGERSGKTVALRADIDALGMNDTTGKAWASQHEGCAHACGHDGHQTWLMGTLRFLHLHRNFAGRVVGLFQPAEEPVLGAKAVIASGFFDKFEVSEIFGAHTEPMLNKGVFGFRVGPLQAACDYFWVKLHGKGAHGARPHQGVDPLPVACQIVNAVQTIVSRKINPIDTAVLSICSLNSGRFESPNVIPTTLTFSGTARMYKEEVRDTIEANFKAMVNGIAQANGCTAEIEYERSIHAVDNAKEQTLAGVAAAKELFGEQSVVDNMDPFMSSEDFAEYQQLVPGTMMRIGIRDEEHTAALHNTAFDFNDEVLPAAVSLFVRVVMDRLDGKL